jgi:hypothetical protein
MADKPPIDGIVVRKPASMAICIINQNLGEVFRISCPIKAHALDDCSQHNQGSGVAGLSQAGSEVQPGPGAGYRQDVLDKAADAGEQH